MAWSYSGHRGSANNKVSGATLTITPSQAVPINAVLVAVAVSDNIATAGGSSNTHIVSDFVGNVWRKVGESTNADAAGAGITVSVWATKVKTQIGTSDAIVFGLSAATTAKAIGLYEYSHGSGNDLHITGSVANAQDGTSSPTVTASGLPNRQYAVLGVVARENDTAGTYTMDSDFNDRTKFGTTGGTGATNVSCIVGDRIMTGTGDTFAPTTLSASADCVTMLCALHEVTPKSTGQMHYSIEDIVNNGDGTATVSVRVRNGLADSGMVFSSVTQIPDAGGINTSEFVGYMAVRWMQGTPLEQLQSEVVRI